MPYYESVFIARQDISNTQVEALADAFSEIIEKGGGNVTSKEHWGLRSLAYKIKKNRKGHYTMFNIDAPSAAILEMERNMRINEDVLRYLTVRVDKLSDEPSIMMQRSRGPRDDDHRRGGRPAGGDAPRRGGPPDGGGSRDDDAKAANKTAEAAKAAKTEDADSAEAAKTEDADSAEAAKAAKTEDADSAKAEDKPDDNPKPDAAGTDEGDKS